MIHRGVKVYDKFIEIFVKYTHDLLLLLIRVYIASIFFQSGWNKLENLWGDGWFRTVYLFKYVHPVPFLSPKIAAVVGTGAEVGFSVLLAIGVMSRVGALGLLGVTAVISLGIHMHFTHAFWALLLGVSFIIGPGKFSFDAWVRSWWNQLYEDSQAHLDLRTIVDRIPPKVVYKVEKKAPIREEKKEPSITGRNKRKVLKIEKEELIEVKSLLKNSLSSKSVARPRKKYFNT